MEKKNKMGAVKGREEPTPRGERERRVGSQVWELEKAGATPLFPREWGEWGSGRRCSGQAGRVAGLGRSPSSMVCMFSAGYWPGHLVLEPGICVLEHPLSGLSQELVGQPEEGGLSRAGLRAWMQ